MCLHSTLDTLVIFASGAPNLGAGKDLSAAVAGSSSTKDPESIDIISRSLQELYEITNPLYIT